MDHVACNTFGEETACSKATTKKLSLWDSLKDQILQVSHKFSALSKNICTICKEHGEINVYIAKPVLGKHTKIPPPREVECK